MILNNIKTRKKDSGFTIVELLVVIVVIGILAAITIVSYSGITARANKSAAVSAANSVKSKAEVYFADGPTSLYPINWGALTTAAATTTYALSGVSFDGTALSSPGNLPTSPSELNYWICGHRSTVGAPTTLNGAGTGILTITGIRTGYWNYESTPAVVFLDNGVVSGTVATFGVGCFITTTSNSTLAAS